MAAVRIESGFVGIIFIFMGIFIFVWGIWAAINGKATEEWVDASGFIITSHITGPGGEIASSTDRYGTFQTKIVYQYTVNGRLYSGSNIAFGDFSIRSMKQATAISQKYPEGRRIRVSYNPDDPTQSVLEPSISLYCYGFMGLGIIAIAAGILTRIAGLKSHTSGFS